MRRCRPLNFIIFLIFFSTHFFAGILYGQLDSQRKVLPEPDSITLKFGQEDTLVIVGKVANSKTSRISVNAIPHYYIIDKNGIIVDNNAPSMASLLQNEWPENPIDKTLRN